MRFLAHLNEAERLGHEVWFHGLGLDQEGVDLYGSRFGSRAHFAPYVLTKEMKPLWWRVLRYVDAGLVGAGLKTPGIDFWFRREWTTQLRQFAARHAFDCVVVEYVFFSKALECFPPDTLKVIDTHDCFSERGQRARQAGLKQSGMRATARTERRGLLRADRIIAIQDQEAGTFRQMLKDERPVITVGHWTEFKSLWPPPTGPWRVGYFGSGYDMNVLAIKWFLRECWPLVKKNFPAAELCIGGGICDLLQPSAEVQLKGRVAEPSQFYSGCYLMINPTIVGSGLKIKNIEALGYGMPLVTTSIGAEGLNEGANKAFMVADDGPSFARAVVKILSNPIMAQNLSDAALQFCEEYNARQRKAFARVVSKEPN
jgi:glycosyltransferase involved in cell wall biosynthesis